ncbi:hypothetical protein [Massilia sp. LC238]|jgi:hypothetical protein|uniref:hypothetical protein n=2 Tax=Massilia TaxID=149698 RepID=UPI0004E40DC6|nr:hypothetical protein [Massilia sp. LC238]KFC73283.1 hypothetical protein FG94_01562 [Massilia sp. LC238]
MEMLTNLYKRVKPHLLLYMIFLVLVLYAASWGLHYFTTWQWLADTLSQAATAIIVSGVFASLLKSYQFSELFKDELKGFFGEPAIIEKMREIAIFGRAGDDVVHKAMEHVLVMTNPDLCASFNKSAARLERVRHDYSLRNFVREITLLDYDASTGRVKIRDIMATSLLVATNTNFLTSSEGEGFEDKKVVTSLTLSTDGGIAACVKNKYSVVENGSVTVKIPVLAGKDYRITRVVDQEYELRKDPIIQQEFARFVDGMTLKVINTVPEKLDFTVRFLNFSDQVEPDVLPGPGNSTITKTYTLDYLTFPLQAFIVTLTNKPQGEDNETKH